MSFFSDWQAAVTFTVDPVSGKSAAVHGKDVSPVHFGDEHQMKATNDPRMPAVPQAPPPPVAKKKNRWGDE